MVTQVMAAILLLEIVMTLKTLLSHAVGNNGMDTFGHPTDNLRFNNYSRGDYHAPHNWLHKGGTNNQIKATPALNALTLLAFLFFLNLLQNCLKENISGPQTPIVVVLSNENNATDMNGTRVVRTKRGVKENNTFNATNFEKPILEQTTQQYQPDFTNLETRNHYSYMKNNYTEQQFINMINDNVKKHWTNHEQIKFKRMPPPITNHKRQKSIEHNIYQFFSSFYSDDSSGTNTPETESTKQSTNSTSNKIKNKPKPRPTTTKKPDEKIQRINDKVSGVVEHDYDDDMSQHNSDDPSLLTSLLWKAMETFKPGLRESAEDTVCCKLVACESSRLSKKLGGYVKYLMKKYVNKGLEWICRTDEKPIKHAFKVGREGKSCADEIEECKPKNFITDFVLFIDYVIV